MSDMYSHLNPAAAAIRERNEANEISSHSRNSKSRKIRPNWKNIGKFFFLLLLVISIGASVYFYVKYREVSDLANSTGEAEIGYYVNKVGQLMQLPEETPSLATVTDKSKLAGQEFFKTAENGDKVLVYINAKKAILFRPSLNKIVDVAPVYTSLTISMVNGVNDIEKVKAVAQDLLKTYSDAQFYDGGVPATKGITSNIVYDVSGKNSEKASAIATQIGGKVVTTYPAGETIPTGVDLVVFVVK